MNAEEVFARCRRADDEIATMRADIARYREIATNVTPKLDAIGGGRGGAAKDGVATYAVELARLQAQLEQREREKAAEEVASTRLIGMLPPTVRSVLHRYYVMRETLNLVAVHEKYSYGYIRKMKADGVRMAREIGEGAVRGVLPGWYIP